MNMKQLGTIAIATALAAGCAKEEKILSVNGEVLTKAALTADIDKIFEVQGSAIPESQREMVRKNAQLQLAKQFVIEQVLAGAAKANGISVTDDDRKTREQEFLKMVSRMPNAPKSIDEQFAKHPLGVERARSDFEKGILFDKLIRSEFEKASAGTDPEAKRKAALEKIKSIKAELDKVPAKELPAKFAELAKKHSECPSSSRGGDLGSFPHGQMVPEFDEAAFKLAPYTVSEPVKTQFGYHLIMSTNKTAAVAAGKDGKGGQPEKVQASHILVKTPDRNSEMREFADQFIDKLVNEAQVEIFDEDFRQVAPGGGAQTPPEGEKPVEKPAAK